MNYTEVIECLHDLKDAEKVIFKEKKFGIISNNSLGKGFNSIAMKDSVQPFAVGDSGIIYSYTKSEETSEEILQEVWTFRTSRTRTKYKI